LGTRRGNVGEAETFDELRRLTTVKDAQ